MPEAAGAGGDPARLFVSIPPPPGLDRRLDALAAQLEASTWTLRRGEPEDLHLTLHFLGATPLRVVDDLKRELGALCHARRRFDLRAGGLGCFPDDLKPRVVFAGVQDAAGKLEELFQASLKLLNAYRLFALRADFHPHLTLARVDRLSEAWDPKLLRALAPQWRDLGVYPVEELRLMRSLPPGQGGPRYEALASMALA
jgi:2'-5' RNA ligase